MPEDIRILLSFRHHRKRKRLLHRLGPQGIVSLIDLWCMVAEQFPSGYLENYTEDDIEIDAGWNGEPGEFVNALLDKNINFIDKKDDGFHMHNWEKRQPWVSNSINRSNISRFNILAKKHRKIHEGLQEIGVSSVTKSDYELLTNIEVTVKQRLKIFKQRLSNAKKNTVEATLKHCLSNAKSGENEATLKQCLENPKQRLSNDEKNGSDFKPNAHVPVPSPSPVPLHNNPETSSGLIRLSDVKNPDGSFNFSDTFLEINNTCNQIKKLPQKNKKFDPNKWAQKKIGKSIHPGAVLKVLSGLVMYWQTTGDPWGWCESQIEKYNGNFNEAEAIKNHEEMKAMNLDALNNFTSGLFREMK